jgi:hypothetical protein
MLAMPALAEVAPDDPALAHSLAELENALGRWSVATEYLYEDGSVARSVEGTYEFSWVVPHRLLTGRSEIPELQQGAGILFYVNESDRTIEMVSVGKDGRLWIMTGALGSDVRHSQTYATEAGGEGQLRFTRSNISDDGFESRMEYTEDGGVTWKPGNHQVFRRVPQAAQE